MNPKKIFLYPEEKIILYLRKDKWNSEKIIEFCKINFAITKININDDSDKNFFVVTISVY